MIPRVSSLLRLPPVFVASLLEYYLYSSSLAPAQGKNAFDLYVVKELLFYSSFASSSSAFSAFFADFLAGAFLAFGFSSASSALASFLSS